MGVVTFDHIPALKASKWPYIRPVEGWGGEANISQILLVRLEEISLKTLKFGKKKVYLKKKKSG